MFGTKKSQTQPEPVETIAAQEHKQSIGNQVMEALGVGENGTGLDEESEILMPKQNQRQLEAEGVVKESVCVISKDAVIGGGIDVKGDLMVAGKVMGHISASTVTCVGETSYIEGNVTCNKLRMHGGKIKGHVTVREKADINGEIPATVDMFVDATKHVRLHSVLSVFSSGSWIYYAVYVILIALFNFFYIEIQFDAVSISSNLRNQGGAVPGYRPGPQTTEMLNKALHKMAQTGSFYLAIIALMPMVLSLISGTQISFGGTSLMIMSSVALEVVRSMEGYLTVRHHKGFLG